MIDDQGRCSAKVLAFPASPDADTLPPSAEDIARLGSKVAQFRTRRHLLMAEAEIELRLKYERWEDCATSQPGEIPPSVLHACARSMREARRWARVARQRRADIRARLERGEVQRSDLLNVPAFSVDARGRLRQFP